MGGGEGPGEEQGRGGRQSKEVKAVQRGMQQGMGQGSEGRGRQDAAKRALTGSTRFC